MFVLSVQYSSHIILVPLCALLSLSTDIDAPPPSTSKNESTIEKSQDHAKVPYRQGLDTLGVPDGVGKGSYYVKPSLPSNGLYIDVYVTHALNPHTFWTVPINNWSKLEALSEDIR